MGYAANWGYHLGGPSPSRDWSYTRNRLMEMNIGDDVVVALSGNRVGRIGKITKAIDGDQWDPFVPRGRGFEDGEMGRRVQVRWDLTVGPDNPDLVVQLPNERRFQQGTESRRAVARIQSITRGQLVEAMNDRSNWVSLLGDFPYEKALSDYIASYANHLEDGLLPHPNSKIRERVFTDRTRCDVLLIDVNSTPVIVECKRHAPSVQDVEQLRDYMRRFKVETGEAPRGMLVHGGAQNLIDDVKQNAELPPVVKVVSYTLNVDFRA